MKNISIIFTSIFFEALPFLLFGAVISALIEKYVSNETIAKLIPKNSFLGALVGVVIGFFIPACDCAVIPVAKRLLKKKVPIHTAVTFMLSSPIINPVVLLSTYYAFFQTNQDIFWLRLGLGVAISLTVGLILAFLFKNKDVVKVDNDNAPEESCCHYGLAEKKENPILTLSGHTVNDVAKVFQFIALN